MGQKYINDFTFGFELEAWGKTIADKESFLKFASSYFELSAKSGYKMDLSTMAYCRDGSIKPDDVKEDCETCGGSGRATCSNCDGRGAITVRCRNCNSDGTCSYCNGEREYTRECPECEGAGDFYCDECDGSGSYNSGRSDQRAFEWKSPVMNINNGNISRTIKFLCEAMNTFNIKTNESCGFHIHIGFPEKKTTHIDRLWILLNLISDSAMMKKITSFENINMFNYEYANFDTIKQIENAVGLYNESDIYDVLVCRCISSSKYVILRQHPQGTLEWRGARGFMDYGKEKSVRRFFLDVFFPFAKWIKDVLAKNEVVVKNKIIYKDKLLKESYRYFNSYPRNIVPLSFIKTSSDARFDLSFNKKTLSYLFKDDIWFFSSYKIRGIYELRSDVDSFFVKGGQLNLKLNKPQKRTISLNDVHYKGGLKFKEVIGSQIASSSSISGEKSSRTSYENCNISNIDLSSNDSFECSIINNGEYQNCEFDESQINNGNFSSGTIRRSSINKGTFKDAEIKKCVITNGKFKNCEISNSCEIKDGYFNNCRIVLTDEITLLNKGIFRNCTFVISNIVFKNINLKPSVFLKYFNVSFKHLLTANNFSFEGLEFKSVEGLGINGIERYIGEITNKMKRRKK